MAVVALAVNLALLLLIAQSAAQLTWQLLSQPVNITDPTSLAAPITADTDSPVVDIHRLANWHLFGRLQSAPAPAQVVIKAPETKLDLRLAGIVFAQGGNTQPRALIANGRNLEQWYSQGASLADAREVRIEQILRDRVILQRNGRLETLSLPKESDAERGPGRAIAANDSGNSTARAKTVDASAIIGEYRAAIKSQPQKLQDLAFASPYMENGQIIGFHLKPGRNRALLGKLGLRRGDILTEINGVALNDPSQGMVLLQQLLNSERIEATVLRNGTEVPYTFLLTE